MPKPDDPGQPPLTFTLDGIEYTTSDRTTTAGEMLRDFGGLDPADYDLVRVVGQGTEQRFADTDDVQLVPNGRYVSLFTGSMPVE